MRNNVQVASVAGEQIVVAVAVTNNGSDGGLMSPTAPHLISGSRSYWWNGGGEGRVHCPCGWSKRDSAAGRGDVRARRARYWPLACSYESPPCFFRQRTGGSRRAQGSEQPDADARRAGFHCRTPFRKPSRRVIVSCPDLPAPISSGAHGQSALVTNCAPAAEVRNGVQMTGKLWIGSGGSLI